MLSVQTNEPEVQITRYALRDITAWLGDEMPRYAREHLMTFVIKLLGSLVLAVAVYVALWFLFAGVVYTGPYLYIGLVLPALPLVFGFFFRLVTHYKAHGVFVLDGERIRFLDDRSYQSDDEPDWFVQFLRWALLPAWMFFSSFESLFKAWNLSRAEPELCAEILANMAAVDRRAPIPEIEDRFRDENLVQTVRGLLAFPGVLVSNREYPCLLLSLELGDTVRQML
jgi:hypothetical protein